MNVLVLGGTAFLGRHVVQAAAAAGHRVTVVHRGVTTCPLPDGVEELLGDRLTDLPALLGARAFDLVVDTSGQDPEAVAASVQHLGPHVGRYVFVSTISVYTDTSRPGMTEDGSAVHELPDDRGTLSGAELYAALKARAETVVTDALGDRAVVVRPGLIVGRWDQSDRFTYWAERFLRGGRVLAPGRPERPVQFVDARDLADWFLRIPETGVSGTFHAAGPGSVLTMGELLDVFTEVAARLGAPQADLAWASDDVLLDAGVGPWVELPLWLPEEGDLAGFLRLDTSRARAAGLTFRPVPETVGDVLDWARTLPPDRDRRAGLDPAAERRVLSRLSGVTP